ncbi:MAG: glycoside hydrolase family 97 protein [Saprospiraceae bacterium]|nr:glycoside hydrolase family 97 protein [Saprospiraceae bacterium]
MRALFYFAFVSMILMTGCMKKPAPSQASLKSPDGKILLEFMLQPDGAPAYSVSLADKVLLDTSTLGFTLKDAAALRTGFEVIKISTSTFDETWETVWGERNKIRNHYNELTAYLREKEAPNRLMNLVFRAYDDGVAFHYVIPEQPGISASFVIMEEHSEFRFTGDHTAWWKPADTDSYEYLYETTPLSKIDASKYAPENERVDRRILNFKAVNTPITMRTAEGVHISLHEARQLDYPDMTLALKGNTDLVSELVPWADGDRVKATLPLRTPWRTITISDRAGGLVESNLILNLNDPNKLKDLSYIEPMVYTGIWWEMHIGKTSWRREFVEGSWSNTGGQVHGATTENTKRHIDFNAANGIRGLLIEGWNTGWEYWGMDTIGFFDFVTPYPDFDIKEVVRYANEKGVAIIGHHETSGDVENYEKHLEKAFQLYKDLGIKSVKTGYAGEIRPKGERHHGQYMIRHYQKVVELAAKYGIAVNAHEPCKDTGLRRTWPNFMTREGLRGTEYEAWSAGNPPEHTVILPFTRLLGGPGDYTAGIFDVLFDKYKKDERVHSTVAKQLAVMVTLYSPQQMAADLPENYEGKPAFQFVRDLAADWDETIVLNAEVGDYLTTVRKAKGSPNWFLGSTTDENARDLSAPLNFLEAGKTYVADIYADGPGADWKSNPYPIAIQKVLVTKDMTLQLKLAPGGGTAISFKPATEEEVKALPTYGK